GQAGNGKLRRCAWLFNGFSYKLKTNGPIEFFATSPKLQEGHFKKTVIARNEATWRSMKLYV
ncbi:MAG: hypothetical protein KGL01_11175, partial [Betaproteobacteria bacterium]|nr:hypothetical protein [Betaproteobacteria bacterium]